MTNDTLPANRLFESSWAKIKRAKFHFEKFRGHLKAQEPDLYSLIGHYMDPQTGERVLQVLTPREFFLGLSIVAGEIVHQARSALDHLAYRLIIANGACPKPKVSGFPIFHEVAKYEKNGWPMLEGMGTAARAIIDGLQPFNTDYITDPLYILNELWNRDKHRLLSVTILRPVCVHEIYQDAAGKIVFQTPVFNIPADAQDGAEIGRFTVPAIVAQSGMKVNQIAEIIGPIFEDAPPVAGKEALKLLPLLIETVEGITNELIATVR